MQFCSDCGGVLNLFGKSSSGLCSACIQHKKEPEPPKAVPQQENRQELDDSTLTVENGKIILRSKEGWQLWSAPVNSSTTLANIVKSAKLIHRIRSKRKGTSKKKH
jgi:hypothetical protein